MKKTLFVLAVLLVGATAAFSEYDSSAVVAVMRGNAGHINAAGKAADSGDFFTAAKEFMALAEGMNSIKHFEPYKGTKQDWDTTIEAFVNTAFQAVGACGMGDNAKVKESVAQLWALNKHGHGEHK